MIRTNGALAINNLALPFLQNPSAQHSTVQVQRKYM